MAKFREKVKESAANAFAAGQAATLSKKTACIKN